MNEAIGVLFDIDGLGAPSSYGTPCWRILMKHLDLEEMPTVVFYQGDVEIQASERPYGYCIAITELDALTGGRGCEHFLHKLSDASDAGLFPVERRFIRGDIPGSLIRSGRVDLEGRFLMSPDLGDLGDLRLVTHGHELGWTVLPDENLLAVFALTYLGRTEGGDGIPLADETRATCQSVLRQVGQRLTLAALRAEGLPPDRIEAACERIVQQVWNGEHEPPSGAAPDVAGDEPLTELAPHAAPPERTDAERALENLRAGDSAEALEILLSMDPALGPALQSLIAEALNAETVRIYNGALEQRLKTSRTLAQVVDLPDPAGERVLSRLLRHRPSRGAEPMPERPTSDMDPALFPPCRGCNSTTYSRWVEFEFDGESHWMCALCSKANERESSAKESVFEDALVTVFEHAALAAELDPDDGSIRTNLERCRELAEQHGIPIPGTDALREKLGAPRIRSELRTWPAPTVCHFCSSQPASPEAEVSLFMSGEVADAAQVFGRGIAHAYSEVHVGRCAACRDLHEQLPTRLEDWAQARHDASAPGCLADLERAVAAKKETESAAAAALEEFEGKAATTRGALQSAETLGEECDRCESNEHWDGALCRQCDAHHFRRGRIYLTVAAAGALGTAITAALTSTGLGASIGAAAATSLVTMDIVRVSKRKAEARANLEWIDSERARLVHESRAQLIRSLRELPFDQLTRELDEALAETREEWRTERAALDAAEAALEKARQVARADFERNHPEPTLPSGVEAEDAYLSSPLITSLRSAGWGFGEAPDLQGHVAQEPVDAKGLVHRAPRSPCERMPIHCPDCEREHRVVDREEERLLPCACGTTLVYRDGVRRGVDRVAHMARLAEGSINLESVRCPECNVELRPSRLVRHYKKAHGPGSKRAKSRKS